MLLQLPNVLNGDQVEHIRDQLEQSEWVDGRVTAGYQSSLVKRNRQLPESHPTSKKLGEIIVVSLEKMDLFLSAALPLLVFPPLFNRYETGDGFGSHVDNAIRQISGTHHRIRTDLSMTIFLSQPEEYDGGELVVEDNYGVHKVKLQAGSAILYPASSIHLVQPVTRGIRLASFSWIQSMVRDDGQRAILLDLDLSIQRLRADYPDDPTAVHLTQVYNNILRQWAEL